MNLFTLNTKDLHKQIYDHLDELNEKLATLCNFIKAGTFRRDINEESYSKRVEYTKELRRIVYNPALFNEILLDANLKEKFFRTFGYKGNLDFTLYPNAWIRDLALQEYEIGKNVYLADGIVLGTNQVSACQKKLKVGPIKIGSRTIFDQGCKIGLKTVIGEECAISVNCSIGLVCNIGDNVKISPASTILHFAEIENNVIIGAHCVIGERSKIEEGVIIPNHTVIPPRSLVTKKGQIINA